MPEKIEFQQPANVNQTFGKSLRLLCASHFQTVFDNAPFRASHQNFLILARLNQQALPRLGLVIAKKHLRLAVQRNRIKRVIRENFRLQQSAFGGLDVIVLSRKGLNELSNATFNHHLNQQWQRLFKKVRHHGLLESHAKPDIKVGSDAPAVN